MDPTMQQADIPMDTTTATENGAETSPAETPQPEAAAPAPPAAEAPTYDDQFPTLGGGPGAPRAASVQPFGTWANKPRVQSSTITQVFHIPAEERKAMNIDGFGVGDTNKKLTGIEANTTCKIEMSSSKDRSLTFLITGKQADVLKAKRMILVNFQTEANATINIPKEHHRFLLGKGGSKLQELERQTATKITIPKAQDTNNDGILVAGARDGIEKALFEIQSISDVQSKQAFEKLDVPKIYHPFIQGASNCHIQAMMAKHPNVRINIPPLSVMKDELSITGEKEGVLACKEDIMRTWKEMEKKCSTICVEVKKSQHRYVIGPRGNAINEILADTGVFVEMPPNTDDSETITLRGPQEKLGLALTKVYEKANSVVNLVLPCPAWLHKYIIGKKGAGIQRISQDLPKVHIVFQDDNTIKVDGPPDEVEKAKIHLEEQVADLQKNTAYADVKVDAKYHKHIIGKGGSTINKIKSESDVTINIPDTDSGATVIRIEGNKAGVERAKAELASMVEKMENEKEKDLIVENRFHRQLIGAKGGEIEKIRKEFTAVQISFPDMGSKSDIVKLRGPKADVDNCAKHFLKITKELQESGFQVKVPIFKQFHKFVIGKGGANIRRIRDETDTRIDLPDSGSDSEMITITGKKENVKKAQAALEQIQSEMDNIEMKEIIIPAKIHNTVIGAGGKLIQSIMSECGGVAIKFPENGSGSDKVTVRGPAEDVEKAIKLLRELSDEKQLSGISVEVKAKPQHHKFLIGRAGCHIQKIRDETGARIIFPGSGDADRESITIIGTKEAVAKAKVELEARITDLDNVVEDSMVVDPKHHKYFVARRGEVLRKIGDEFGGVVVSFPRNGVASDKVSLKGAKDCIEGAMARITEIVQDLVEQVTIDCEIEQQFHRTVMGAKGSKVQKITQDFGVQIKFPDKAVETNGEEAVPERAGNPNVIRITGKRERCESASAALLELVPITAEVAVPYEFHRFIIGQKGVGVREMMNRFDVNIRVPSQEAKSDLILISGVPSNVESAKGGLAERMAELELEKEEKVRNSFVATVSVAPEYHPKIIGRKGAVITKLRDEYHVNIQLPKKEADCQEVITITGCEENAEKAKAEILKIVGQFESMVKVEQKIDPRVHSMIIGKGGRSIRKIMEDYKVDIRLPRAGDEDPALVIISGDQDACDDCIDHLKLLEEAFIQEAAEADWERDYLKPTRQVDNKDSNKKKDGFHVSKAPWDVSSAEAFPSLGGGGGGGQHCHYHIIHHHLASSAL
jgi:polyribonucleotide nucleotidyltransferase